MIKKIEMKMYPEAEFSIIQLANRINEIIDKLEDIERKQIKQGDDGE